MRVKSTAKTEVEAFTMGQHLMAGSEDEKAASVMKKEVTVKKAVVKRRRRATWKRGAGELLRKQRWFDSFGTRKTLVTPEKGIHSLEWALNIAPQSSTLFALPLEVRQRIFTLTLLDNSRPLAQPLLQPGKCGKKFTNRANYDVVRTYTALSLTSRQFYLEVVGSALLHKMAIFSFPSPTLMVNYLSRINPALKTSIGTLSLNINLHPNQRTISFVVFDILLSLTGLRKLTLTISMVNKAHTFMRPLSYPPGRPIISGPAQALLTKIEEQDGWEKLRELRLVEFKVDILRLTYMGQMWVEPRADNGRIKEFCEKVEKVVMGN